MIEWLVFGYDRYFRESECACIFNTKEFFKPACYDTLDEGEGVGDIDVMSLQ